MSAGGNAGPGRWAPWTDAEAEVIRKLGEEALLDSELEQLRATCARTGLDPLTRQVYATVRFTKQRGSDLKRRSLAIQTGIDGFRAVADRTGCYAPGRATEFAITTDGKRPLVATAYVRKMTPDKTWHEVAESARWEEFVQTNYDGKPSRFWSAMPFVMLEKCAEARALRRAFPLQLSGVYAPEEIERDLDAEPAAAPAPAASAGVPPRSPTTVDTYACNCACGCTVAVRAEAAAATIDRVGAVRCPACFPGRRFDPRLHPDSTMLLMLPKAPAMTVGDALAIALAASTAGGAS